MNSDNRQLKKDYKLTQRSFGIVLIRNTTNDKVFLIGGMDIQGMQLPKRSRSIASSVSNASRPRRSALSPCRTKAFRPLPKPRNKVKAVADVAAADVDALAGKNLMRHRLLHNSSLMSMRSLIRHLSQGILQLNESLMRKNQQR